MICRQTTFIRLLALTVTAATLAGAQNTGDSDWHTEQTTKQDGYTFEEVPAPLKAKFYGGWKEAREKAEGLVSQMTIEEKANLTGGLTQSVRCEGMTGSVKRLGIEELCFQDGPLGIRPTDGNSVFPAGVSTAATFDKTLMYQRGVGLGEEFKAKGINVWLGPVTGGPLGRTAFAGRNWEGFGADQFLHGVAAYQTVSGAQSAGVIATAKHFIAYEQETYRSLHSASDPFTYTPQNNSRTISSNVDDRTLHEVYLYPFAEAVRAGAGSLMISYNRVNGTPAAQHAKLLNGILKTELGFPGVVISDWYATYDGLSSALNGLDLEMPNSDFMGLRLVDAVKNGTLSEGRLDDMATRLLTSWYKQGQDKGYPKPNYHGNTLDTYFNGSLVNEHKNVQSDHYKIIRKIATDSITLLKHNGTLPLKKGEKKLGVFGSDATIKAGGPNSCASWIPGSSLCPDNSTFKGTTAIGWGSGASRFPYLIDPLSALNQKIAGSGGWISESAQDYDEEEAAATAALSDVCLVFTSARSGEDSDRFNLTLWDNGDELVERVASQCNETVVILHTVGPNIIEKWVDHPNVTAIVNAHLPGQESGNAIVDVLFGDVTPSGKLPYSWPKTDDVYPPIEKANPDDPSDNFNEKLLIDYRYLDAKNITPRYEFGFGLSYTTFSLSGISVQSTRGSFSPSNVTAPSSPGPTTYFPGGDSSLFEYILHVSGSVKNTGDYNGAEVVQVYVSYPDSAGEPPKQLRGFDKISVSKGSSKGFAIPIRRKDLSVWDVESQAWKVPKGTFTIWVGNSSKNLKWKKQVTF